MTELTTFATLASVTESPTSPAPSAPSLIEQYCAHGWHLVPIPPARKGPIASGWNTLAKSARMPWEIPPGFGAGLAHAWSGTCALDIDDLQAATAALESHQIDLQALIDSPDAVIIDSGREGRSKLLYRHPADIDPLASQQVRNDDRVIFELRCATRSGLTVQDVLPPSIHPDTGQPYRWAGRGHWSRLPALPAPLLALWQSLLPASTTSTTITTQSAHTTAEIAAKWIEIESAIRHINPGCNREEWRNVGMALHHFAHTIGTSQAINHALAVWNDWSSGSTKYPGAPAVAQQWRSFKFERESPITIGTFWVAARKAGWRPRSSAEALFGATDTAPSPTDTAPDGKDSEDNEAAPTPTTPASLTELDRQRAEWEDHTHKMTHNPELLQRFITGEWVEWAARLIHDAWVFDYLRAHIPTESESSLRRQVREHRKQQREIERIAREAERKQQLSEKAEKQQKKEQWLIEKFGSIDNATEVADRTVAEAFAAAHKDQYVHCSPLRGWYVRQDHKWIPDECSQFGRALMDYCGNEWTTSGYVRYSMWSGIKAVESAAAQIMDMHPTALDISPHLLNTPGGVIDLRTAQFAPPGSDPAGTGAIAWTKSSGITPTPGPAPLWDRFMSEIFCRDTHFIDWMQKFLGYCITGENSEKKFFICFGEGDTGKSTLWNIVAELVGDYLVRLPSTALTKSVSGRHPTDLMMLKGARLSISSEFDRSEHFNDAVLKEITGEQTMTARYCGRDSVTFPVTSKLVMMVNDIPRFRGDDGAMRRRLVVIPFRARITRPDKSIVKRIIASEGAQVLHWLCEGAARWYQTGLGDIPAQIRATSDDASSDNDPLSDWLRECCTLDPQLSTPTVELYQCYRLWKESRGERTPSINLFSRDLGRRGFERHTDGKHRGYKGVQLTIDAQARYGSWIKR